MAARLGSAFVSIEADTDLFRAQALAGVKKAIAGISADIPVTADASGATKTILALKARMEALSKGLSEFTIDANDKPALAKVLNLQAKLAALAKTVSSITMDADTTRLDAKITRAEAELAVLQRKGLDLQLNADDTALTAKISGLILQAETLEARLAKLGPDDTTKIAAYADKIRAIDAQVELLSHDASDVELVMRSAQFDTAIAAKEAEIAVLKKQAADVNIGGDAKIAGLTTAASQLVGLEAAFKALTPEATSLNAALITGGGAWGRYGLGALTARVALFGGLTAVSGLHLALDGIVEILAVTIPAISVLAGGLGAFAAAAALSADTAGRISDRLKIINTVMGATNTTIAPMTDNFDKMQNVIRPEVFSLYGAAINATGSQLGVFNTLAESTGGVLDKVAARIVVDMKTGSTGIATFVAAGQKDLNQFGQIFTNIGALFATLIRVTQQTHIADDFLEGIKAASGFLALLSKIPTPLLAAVVGFHALYLYGGLAVSAMLSLGVGLLRPIAGVLSLAAGSEKAGTAVKDLAEAGGGTKFQVFQATLKDIGTSAGGAGTRIGGLGAAVVTLASSPWTWAAVAVAALAGLGYEALKTRDYTDGLVTSINNLVSRASVFNLINAQGAALIQTNTALAAAQVKLNTEIGAGGQYTAAYKQGVGGLTASEMTAAGATKQLAEEHVKLVGNLQTTTGHLVQITQAFGTNGLAGAEALASLAGVKVSDLQSTNNKVWATAIQLIANVVTGYADMGQGANQLGSDINALTVANSDQLKNVQALNTAYDQFTKIVSGPVTTFVTFANAVTRFGADAGAAGAQLGGLGDGAVTVSRKMTTASLQLTSDFQDTFTAANNMADAMRLTGTSMEAQTQAIKDTVQVMIPMAGTSKLAAAEISSLAQEAGGPATTNLQVLAKWAGKTADPLNAAQKASDNAAIGFANLSVDAQKLATTLQQDLTADMGLAVAQAVGLQGALNAFAIDVKNGATQTAAGQKDRRTLTDDLSLIGVVGPQASDVIKTITNGIHTQAGIIAAAAQARLNLIDDFKSFTSFGKPATSDVEKLTTAILTQGTTAAQKRQDRLNLIRDLEQSGLNAHDATGFVDTYLNQLAKIPATKATSIIASATGTGHITFAEQNIKNAQTGFLEFHATGGPVGGSGAPTADDQIIAASTGEYVINAQSSRRLGMHRLNRLNSYAAGGLVDSPSDPSIFMTNESSIFETKAVTQFMQAAIAQYNAKVAAELAAIGSGTDIVSYARSFLGTIPYVFGGTSLSGMDCSGFSGMVYKHFGYSSIPRTSEAQSAWVQSAPAQPGALAFYHSPAGGTDPGHVAIIDNDSKSVISQGGGLGPTSELLHFLPLLSTGVPPGGFKTAAATGTTAGRLTATQIANLWDSLGGRASASGNMAAIANAESGDDPSIVQAGQPPGLTGYGLYQITPTSGISQNGRFGNLLNASNNTRAAISLYNASGYLPWASDPVASRLIASGLSYAGGGPVGMAAGGAVTPASWLSTFKSGQASEYGVWAGLYNAFRGHTAGAAGTQLKALAHAQSAEEAGYDRILGGGDSPANLSLLTGRLRSVASGAKGSALVKAHPGWMKNLGIWVSRLLGMSTSPAPLFTGTTPGGAPVNPPWNPGNLGASMHAAGGVQTFDRGGVLKPGYTMAYNGTGAGEMVGGGGAIHLHLTVNGPVGSQIELENWYVQTANKMARTGRLTQAVTRAAGHR